MLSILFCQTHRVSLNLNQANVQKYPFINFQKTTTSKENRLLFSNHNKNYSFSYWFYFIGPYHDRWGSDILPLGKHPTSGPICYYPLGNSILSLMSSSDKNKIGEASVVYINFFGINFKKNKL